MPLEGEAQSLQQLFVRSLEAAPEARALAFVEEDGGHEWLDRESLYRRAAELAAVLRQHGLESGQACVIVLPAEPIQAMTVLGVLWAGALPLLVAPPVVRGLHSNLAEVLLHVVGRTGARVVVVGEGMDEIASRLEETGTIEVVTAPEDLEPDGIQPADPVLRSGSDLAALQLTSGTTGFPRICVWKHRAVLAALDGMVRAMDLVENDVCVNWTPLYHDMGLVNNFLLCTGRGFPLALIPTMSFLVEPACWLRTLDAVGGTVTWSPNFGFALVEQRVTDEELEGVRLDGVRAFWNAAERIHLETIEAFHRRFAAFGVSREALKTNFGCAENVGGATFSDPQGQYVFERVVRRTLYRDGSAELAGDALAADDIVAVMGAGRPYPGMKIQILSPDLKPLPDGEVGQVVLDTPSRMEGYLADDEANREAFVAGMLKTGDLGYLRGDEFFWVGRHKEVINLHGEKLDPSELEAPLLRVEGLRKGCFAAFGVDDPGRGTETLVVVAEVVRQPDRPVEDLRSEVRSRCARELGVRVGEILLLPHGSMSKTSSGKRRHRFYQRLYLDGELRDLDLRAPSVMGTGSTD